MVLRKSKIDYKLAQSLIADIGALARMLEEEEDSLMLVPVLNRMLQGVLDHTVNLTALNKGYKTQGRLRLLEAVLEKRES